ncbi:MAG: autotransporter outer membrane beta-barrel domain-containing protein, partial [Centipeda sp. (in: firmicutes)]
FGSYTRISRNIDQGRLNKFNDHILVSCIGGYQHYNGTGNTHYTALNIAKIDQNTGRILGTEQRRASIPNHVKGTGEDMRDLKLLPDGTAYVMTYNLSPSGSQINAHVYKTTMSNLMSEHPDDWQEVAVASQQEGWFGKLNAEYYTKRLWLELGDTLQAYTDGDDTAKHIWQAKDFSDNKAFSRFNKITMIEPDRVYGNTASVVMTLPAELGGDTTAATVNENAVWKNSAAFSDTITTQQSWNIDTVVSIGKDKLGDKSTNVLAAISATDSRPLNINAGENILQLQVENTVGNPTGIYARGADLTVSAKKGINILTRGSEGGNSLTNAVQLDALKNKATKLTINGPLNISMTGGLGGNGVAIQKSDRFGEKSYEARLASAIRIKGNLKIAGTETDKWGIPLNRENVFSRFNNAGILTQVEKSDVTVDGDVDMTVYGNGVTTNAKDSSVHIAGGGSIQVPAGMRYSYYALAAYQGAISMNMGDDGTKPGNPKEGKALADVKLDGDLFALPTGRLDVALMTDKSYLHGLVDNGGTANLYLQNGAKWLNEARNERYYQDDEDMGAGTMAAVRTRTGGAVGKVYNAQSHVTNFVGGATEAQRGIIYQKNANPLTIDKYSGHTAAVYSHDIASPTVFTGGEIIIKKANADTKNIFTLFTDGGGVTTGNQSAVLNALANKLSYQSFAENKLLGKLSIGESLTTSTINGEITFGNETGSYAGGTTPPKPPSTEQTKTAFTEQLIQKDVAEYKNANVEPSPGSYKFTKDTTISKTSYTGVIFNTGFPKKPLTVDASGHVLTLKGERNSGLVTGINNRGENGVAIAAGTVKINVKSDIGKAFGVWNTKNGSTIKITGNLDISASGGDSAKGLSASKDATIEADGLDVTLNKASLDAWSIDNDGIIKVNKDGTHKVILRGNILSGVNGSTDLSLTTAESALNGVVHQKEATANGVSLLLTNGAVWNNQDWNQSAAVLEKLSFAGSRLSSLRGGNDANNAGVIFQKNSKDITIDDYNGHTRVFYEHDTARPTTIKGGDFRIKNASAGSAITLTTDSGGLNTESTKAADKNLVSATLNALANKLWYTAYTTNERNLTGKAEIAEGLTTSSASKRVEDITFNESSGQGSYVYTPATEGQTKTEFTKRLFGTTSDQEYVDANVRQADGTYRFTKDSNIIYTNAEDEDAGVINPTEDVKIDASGHTLTVETKVHGARKAAAIKNAGKKLNIAADTLRLFTNKNEVSDAEYSWGILNESGTTNISGMTEIDTTGYESSRAVEATEGTVTLEGLKAKVAAYNDAAALFTGSSGQIYANVKEGTAGSNTVKIDGNVGAMGEASRIDVAMVNKDSGVNGLAFGKGKINFWLQNGAVWNNEQYGATVPDKEDNQLGHDYDYTFAGSRLSSLRGGNDANNAGVIFQKNNKDITIDNYSGHTRVFYEHDVAAPTTIKGGDFRIKNAAVGSGITLTTDSSGLNTESTKATDKNLVSATLNALANKLWYTAYTTNERNLTGKVEIAEGLTSSSASKRLENITFDAASGQGRYVYTPQSEATTDPIKESETLSYDRQALATAPNTKGGRIVSGLYTDNAAYDKQHPMVVDMNGHSLHIEANSKNQIASAIHGGNNKYIRIVNSGEKKSLTIKASNTDTRAANGIQTEANGHIHIQGPVVIEDVHTKGYNAAAIQTNGTIGSPSDVTIDGDLTVQSVRADRVDTKNKGADDGRNVAGLKTTADESKITVKGNVDIQNIKGSVLQTIGADSVIDVGGGTISAAEDADHTKQYRAVRAEKGTVNINTPEGVSGSRKTNITGDMYVTREYGKKVVEYSGGQLVDFDKKGMLNVSLTTADSSWTGAATYDVNQKDYGQGGFTAHDVGQFNLTLQNGARWTNELRSGVTDKWLGSHVSRLSGGSSAQQAGLIFQKNERKITIDNYSGYARVFYEHDAATPTNIKGGDIDVKSASGGSRITLITDQRGLNTSTTAGITEKNLVNATLNALANKLWYTGYVTNERNLLGQVQIAEGLTSSSASKRLEDITFDKTTGQGSYVYTPLINPPASQTQSDFTTAITGDETHDTPYVNAGVRKADGRYVFTKDSTITSGKDLIAAGAWMSNISAAISSANKGTLDLDLSGKNLTIKTKTDVSTTGISSIGKDSKVIVKNAGAISIDAESTNHGQTATLFVNGGGAIHIQNGGSNLEDKVLKVRANGNSKTNVAVVKSMNGVTGVESNITIDGLVDVLADGNDAANG